MLKVFPGTPKYWAAVVTGFWVGAGLLALEQLAEFLDSAHVEDSQDTLW